MNIARKIAFNKYLLLVIDVCFCTFGVAMSVNDRSWLGPAIIWGIATLVQLINVCMDRSNKKQGGC